DDEHDHDRERHSGWNAARRHRDPLLRRDQLGHVDREGIAVGDPDGSEHDAARHRADEDLRPHRPHRKAVAPAAAARGDLQKDDRYRDDHPKTPARPLSERANTRAHYATAEHLKGRIERSDRLPLRVPEDEAPPDEEAAERNDERRDTAERDDEALQSTEQRSERDADDERDDPRVRLFESEPQALRDPDRLEHRHRVSEEAKHRSDRQVDVARDDDQDHAGRHDPDRRALDREVPEIPRTEERSARQEVEGDPDHG